MQNNIVIDIVGVGKVEVTQGVSLFDLSEAYKHVCARPILVAKVDNELHDLSRALLYDAKVQFLDITDPNGFRAYQRGVSFMMVYAIKTILGKTERVVISHSINKNFYCDLPDRKAPLSNATIQEIEDFMHETALRDMPIQRKTIPRESAIKIAEELGLMDKVSLLKYQHQHTVSFYKLNWMYNYFYGEIAPRTGRLNMFKLVPRTGGFVLQFPSPQAGYEIAPLAPQNRVHDVFKEYKQWARILKVDTVGALNDKLCGSSEIIQIAEALHEKKLALLADTIMAEDKPIVLIAGPTSSGKTTFAHRLGVQLRVNGALPHIISLDNYYLNREDCPIDEYGNYDFETIRSIDTAQINHDLNALLDGQEVEIPTFNFLTGKREYKGNRIRRGPSDVLVLEGIHGLNDLTTAGVPAQDKFKIFISPLTQINIDDHNRIPTTDTRLLRRIVRDNRTRGTSAAHTLSMWASVQRGEAKYIYPWQQYADAFFNSTLVYEMGVIKQYAEPLLFNIKPHQPEYTEARRLIKFLSSFLTIPSEAITPHSILREFVGGGTYHH